MKEMGFVLKLNKKGLFLLVNKTYQDERLSDGTKISDLTIPEEGIISSKVGRSRTL